MVRVKRPRLKDAAAGDGGEPVAGGEGSVAQCLAQLGIGGGAAAADSPPLAARFSALFSGAGAAASSGGLHLKTPVADEAAAGAVARSTNGDRSAGGGGTGSGGEVGGGKSAKEETAKAEAGKAQGRERQEKRRLSEQELRERETRTLFVGNVPLAWDKARLRRTLRIAIGDVYQGPLRPIWFRAEPLEEKWTGNLRKAGSILRAYSDGAADAKNAYVVLESAAAVRSVSQAVHGYQADERHVLRADGVGASSKLTNFDRKRSVYVGNLPYATSEADLREVFAPAGHVDAVRVVRDREHKTCKGFAFVRFQDRSSVKKALDLWGAEVQGREIRVMKVSQQPGAGDGDAGAESLHPAAMRIQMKNERKRRRKLANPRRGGGAAGLGGAAAASSRKKGAKGKRRGKVKKGR